MAFSCLKGVKRIDTDQLGYKLIQKCRLQTQVEDNFELIYFNWEKDKRRILKVKKI